MLHCCFYYLFGPIPECSNEDFFQLYIFSFMFSEEILKKLQIPVYIPAVLAMMSDPFSRKLSTSFIHQQYLTSPKNYLVNLWTLKRKNLKTHIMTRINANHSVKFKALTSIFFIRTLQHPYTRKHVTFTENWYYNLQREFFIFAFPSSSFSSSQAVTIFWYSKTYPRHDCYEYLSGLWLATKFYYHYCQWWSSSPW